MRSNRAEFKGSPAALAVILIMLVGIVGYFVATPRPYTEGLLPATAAPEYSKVVLDVAPGKVSPAEEFKSTRMVSLLTATVDNTPVTSELPLSQQVFVKKSLFKLIPAEFYFNFDKDAAVAARLHLAVAEKTGSGLLAVELNSRRVFSRQVGVGETLDVDLPSGYLADGLNQLKLTVLSNDLGAHSYILLNIRIDTDAYADGAVEHSFSLTDNAAKSYSGAELSAYIKSEGATGNLKVELNGAQVFNAIPSQDFRLDISANQLNSGPNSLRWSAERGAKYLIQYGKLVIDELELEEGAKKYYFSVGEKEMYYIRQPRSYTCELSISRQSGADELFVTLNSETKTYSFEGNQIAADACELLKEGANKIILAADEDTILSSVTLTVKNK